MGSWDEVPTLQIFVTVEVSIQAFLVSSSHHIENQLLVYTKCEK